MFSSGWRSWLWKCSRLIDPRRRRERFSFTKPVADRWAAQTWIQEWTGFFWIVFKKYSHFCERPSTFSRRVGRQ
jgi:hypothetical protein